MTGTSAVRTQAFDSRRVVDGLVRFSILFGRYSSTSTTDVPRKMLSVLHSYHGYHKRQILSSDIDYYSRYVCTSSADGLVQIVDTVEPHQHSAVELREHAGPVWRVAFSHPKFGFLASCGSDGKLVLYKTNKLNEWNVTYVYNGHGSSATSVDWAPHKAGAIVACSSADGTISIHTLNSSNEWSVSKIPNAHLNGVNCISWASQIVNGRLLLVSGGNDNKMKIWQDQQYSWGKMHESDNQRAAIKDISWCPTPGLQTHMIATCASDGRVVVWGTENFYEWMEVEVDEMDREKQKVSWSRLGNILSISMNSYVVKLWKQIDNKNWMLLDRKVSEIQPEFEQKRNSLNQHIIFSDLVR